MIPREVMDWQMGGAYPLIVEIPGIAGHREGPDEPDRFDPRRRGDPRIASEGQYRREQVQMETVRTSEVLESQILEDARAKAKRTFGRRRRRSAEAMRAEGESRDAEEARGWTPPARHGSLRCAQDLEASLPLDFMRSRLEFLQKAVSGALDETVCIA